MEKRYDFVTWLRVAGVIMILLCHFMAQSTSAIFNMSAQFFNVGVEVFIILSGFLFGVRRGIGNPIAWYAKRLKRIYVPYELFVLLLAVIHFLCGIFVWKVDWLWLILGLQGSVVGVLGAEQTWFITPLLICYALTPLLDKAVSLLGEQQKRWLFAVAIAVLPIVWALFPAPGVHRLLSLVSCYILAFMLGYTFDYSSITKGRTLIACGMMCGSILVRLMVRHFFDGTVFYDQITVGYTQMLSAFCLFFIFAFLFQHVKPFRAVEFVSEISFEVYLAHYMFCVGPIRLFGLTPNWILNCLIVTCISVIIGFLIHKASNWIIKKLR